MEILIFWFILSLLVITQYGPMCKGLNNKDLVIVFIVLLIGGPFFTITTILEAILNYFLPEGWNDDN